MPAERRVEDLVRLHFAPQRRIARNVGDEHRRRRIGHVIERRAIAMAEDGVLAAVIEIDESPYLAAAGGRGGYVLQLHLREIVDVVTGESAGHAVGAGGGRREFRHDDARQRIAIGVHDREAMRDEVVAVRIGQAGNTRGIGLRVLDREVIFRRVPAAHAFLADEQIFDIDARNVVAAGRELDGIARRHLRQRVVQRATRVVVVIAIAGIGAGGRHEARTHSIRMAVHDGRRQKHRGDCQRGRNDFPGQFVSSHRHSLRWLVAY